MGLFVSTVTAENLARLAPVSEGQVDCCCGSSAAVAADVFVVTDGTSAWTAVI
jgi:hypothetical protein